MALAILTVASRYALQLRDDLPTIALPGQWSLFGGAVEAGESPREAVRREIREELRLDIPDWIELWRVLYFVPYWDAVVPHRIFTADVTAIWERHVLQEGQAAGVFAIDALPEPMPPIVAALLERHDAEQRGGAATRAPGERFA